MSQGRVTVLNKIKNASITGLFASLLKCFGFIVFQFPADNYKLSTFGVLCFSFKVLHDVYELYATNEIDSSYYHGKSEIINISSIISCVIYGIFLFSLSFLSFIKRKKVFELFKRIEAMEKNVIVKLFKLIVKLIKI